MAVAGLAPQVLGCGPSNAEGLEPIAHDRHPLRVKATRGGAPQPADQRPAQQ